MSFGKYTLAAVLMLTAPAFGKTVVDCDGGEELQLKIDQKTDGSYVANATIQSVGDSYPTFHYKVDRKVAAVPGGPLTYSGQGFKLELHVDAAPSAGTIHGDLRIDDLDIDQALDCQLK